ncbi:MAG TPA: FtsX-like permease family protein [Allosphingosinicella sp.]|jgi:cell division transport system permease protein|nr:FtsX-like permease family protein [Allosphingosinicella sp.]
MKAGARKFGAADARLLPEGRLSGPMPWVIAIMMFLTLLAAAAGLGLGSAAASLDTETGNRATVQIVEPNPDARESQARDALALLARLPGVTAAERVAPDEMRALLEPWLGPGGMEADLPIPAMIDIELSPAAYARMDGLRAALADVAPAARVDDNAQWLAPLAGLIGSLRWLAGSLVVLMIGATAATVVLAARASLDTHRGTIEVLHLMGATDVQVARLFQRRIALDALFGGAVGLAAAGAVLLLIGNRLGALGSELLGSAGLPVASWAILVALPVFGVLLAMIVARATILRALGRLL